MSRDCMDPLAELIGESPQIVAMREQIRRLLQRQSGSRRLPPILIQGETGTGKGLLAQAIHRADPRAAGPFVSVNCAAIPEALLETEMFGFERRAVTDARQAKLGLFQTAHRGTLFLDEVGLLPQRLQSKLLKAIEEREVRRLGSTRSEAVDVWILTATSEDLATARHERRFHEALYHRLSVLTLYCPRCASGAGTSCCSLSIFSPALALTTLCSRRTSPLTPIAPCSPTAGQATSGSSLA